MGDVTQPRIHACGALLSVVQCFSTGSLLVICVHVKYFISSEENRLTQFGISNRFKDDGVNYDVKS
jgi:hypothetical protein